LDSVIEAFIVDRAARGLSPRTIMWYREKLVVFRRYVTGAEITSVEQLTARTLRAYLLDLGRTHNAGGATAVFERCGRYCGGMSSSSSPRTGSALCTVCPPNVSLPPLQPVPLADVRSMVATCSNDTFEDLRDRAVLLGLLDTGCRASEFVAFAVGDIHLGTGEATVRNGKGGKSRAVFLGTTARVALRAYLAVHPCPEPLSPLWVSRDGGPLAYSGLRELLRRRARKAGVSAPSLHSFRRAFALGCLRNGVDVISLQRLLGHPDLSILNRYLALTTNDLQRAHREGGPVDRLLGGAEPEPASRSAQPDSGTGSGGPGGRRAANSCQAAESSGRSIGFSTSPETCSARRIRATAQRTAAGIVLAQQRSRGNGQSA